MGVAGPDKVPVDPDKALAEEPADIAEAEERAEAPVAVAGQSRSRAYWNSLT